MSGVSAIQSKADRSCGSSMLPSSLVGATSSNWGSGPVLSHDIASSGLLGGDSSAAWSLSLLVVSFVAPTSSNEGSGPVLSHDIASSAPLGAGSGLPAVSAGMSIIPSNASSALLAGSPLRAATANDTRGPVLS